MIAEKPNIKTSRDGFTLFLYEQGYRLDGRVHYHFKLFDSGKCLLDTQKQYLDDNGSLAEIPEGENLKDYTMSNPVGWSRNKILESAVFWAEHMLENSELLEEYRLWELDAIREDLELRVEREDKALREKARKANRKIFSDKWERLEKGRKNDTK